ncbi:hypothetical protein FACS1894110_20710 [Spirochaetia bacterium]|nr:hypothetical protein FACS1894110_20710 [Spirochaetia bacterium]
MKRLIALLGFLACMNFMVFAQEDTEKERIETSWLSVGFNWGNNFNIGDDIGNFYSGSPGVNFSGYGFYNQSKIGFFFNYGLMFPVVNNIENGYSPIDQADFLMGVGFRHELNKKLNLHFGVGPNFNMYFLLNKVDNDVKATDARYSFGIGGDIGLKFDLTDSIFIDVGTTLSYDFATYRTVDSTNDNWTNTKRESSGWITNSFFGIKPYVAIGFNVYQKTSKAKLGKPKL